MYIYIHKCKCLLCGVHGQAPAGDREVREILDVKPRLRRRCRRRRLRGLFKVPSGIVHVRLFAYAAAARCLVTWQQLRWRRVTGAVNAACYAYRAFLWGETKLKIKL